MTGLICLGHRLPTAATLAAGGQAHVCAHTVSTGIQERDYESLSILGAGVGRRGRTVRCSSWRGRCMWWWDAWWTARLRRSRPSCTLRTRSRARPRRCRQPTSSCAKFARCAHAAPLCPSEFLSSNSWLCSVLQHQVKHFNVQSPCGQRAGHTSDSDVHAGSGKLLLWHGECLLFCNAPGWRARA